MSGRERLHDDELVIRCGKPPFDLFKLITEGCVDHPDGHFGFSVVVPKDWGMDAARTLMGFFEELTNPVPKERRP
jgi:hypothetical protein